MHYKCQSNNEFISWSWRNLYDIELSCADPGIFVREGGGVQVHLTKKLWQPFFSPQLILQSQMVNFKENYHFSRFPRGSNIFQGVQLFPGWGVPIAYSYRKYITCDFPGEVQTPCPPPPLDPHLGLSMVLSIHAENAPNLTNRYLGMFLEGQVDRQTGA